MSENPFGGEGGFDLNALVEQAQAMQSQLMAAQEELANAVVEGSSGPVTLRLSGTGELDSIVITPGSFDGADPESVNDLEDLIVVAYRDAKSKADAMANQALGPAAGVDLEALDGHGPNTQGGTGAVGFGV